MSDTAYKIVTAEQWIEWQAHHIFAGAPVDHQDGFIHLSAADQVAGTLAKHFAGRTDLMLVTVDLAVLADVVKWEVSRGGALFPHVYGMIPMGAVIDAGPIAVDDDGVHRLGDLFPA